MLRQGARTVARQRVANVRLPPSYIVRRTFLEPAPSQTATSTGQNKDGPTIQAAPAASTSSLTTSSSNLPDVVTAAPAKSQPAPNPAHRKLIQQERKRAAAGEVKEAPQLLVTNARTDKGKEREQLAPELLEADNVAALDEAGGRGTGAASSSKGQPAAIASGSKEPVLEGEWLRRRQQMINSENQPQITASQEEGLRSFSEYASTSTPISNSLLVTVPGMDAAGLSPGSSQPPSPDSNTASPSESNVPPKGSSDTASSTSSTSKDVGFLPFLPLRSVPIPHIRHPFNTNRFVSSLERTGEFERGTAEEVMRATKALLTVAEDEAARHLVAKTDLENEAYLFSAALSELRTEVQMTARTDSIALRSLNSQLQREVDSLSQKMREDMNSLKNDNQLDLNNRKEEASTDINTLEQRILDLNSKFTLLVGDTRASLEANKWIQTRRSIVMIVALAIIFMAYTASRPAPPPPPPPRPPSIDELGLRPIEDADSAADGGFFSGWLGGSGGPTPVSGKVKKDGQSQMPPSTGQQPRV